MVIKVPRAPLTPMRIPLPKQVEKTFKDPSKYDRKRMKQDFRKDITERLDRVASEIEKKDPRLALAVDIISDHLENHA